MIKKKKKVIREVHKMYVVIVPLRLIALNTSRLERTPLPTEQTALQSDNLLFMLVIYSFCTKKKIR